MTEKQIQLLYQLRRQYSLGLIDTSQFANKLDNLFVGAFGRGYSADLMIAGIDINSAQQ